MVVRVDGVLEEAVVELCRGQDEDVDALQEGKLTLDWYVETVRKKTGMLLGTATGIGALVASGDYDQAQWGGPSYLEDVGVLFQLQDVRSSSGMRKRRRASPLSTCEWQADPGDGATCHSRRRSSHRQGRPEFEATWSRSRSSASVNSRVPICPST